MTCALAATELEGISNAPLLGQNPYQEHLETAASYLMLPATRVNSVGTLAQYYCSSTAGW